MATSIVFTDNGATTIIEWSDGDAQTLSANKSIYGYSRTDDTFRINTIGNANVIGEFVNADLTTPYGDADALEVALQGFFNGGLGGYTEWEISSAELLSDIGVGLPFLGVPAANGYYLFEGVIENVFNTTAYNAVELEVKSSTITIWNCTSAFMASTSNRVVPLQNGATSTAKFVPIMAGSQLLLKTTTGLNPTTGNGKLRVKVWWKYLTIAP